MLKKIILLVIIIVLLSGCSTEIDVYPKLPIDADTVPGDNGDAQEVASIDRSEGMYENNEWVMVSPGGPEDAHTQLPSESVLLNQEQAVRFFMDAWEQNDLEKMNMLTLQSLEEFFRQSNINFISYEYLDKGDLLGFTRDGMGKIKKYGAGDINSISIDGYTQDSNKLRMNVGDLGFDITLALDRNMWKLETMSADVSGLEQFVVQEQDSLGQLVLVDIRDMDGDGNYELLAMGFRGEWEGIGSEPTSAIGIYKSHDEQISNLYFRDMNDRLEGGRVVMEGGMGRVLEGQPVLLVLIEKTAQDNLAIIEGPAPQYYVSLYRLENRHLIKIGEIDWEGAVTDVLDSEIVPEWIELLGVKKLKRGAVESVVLRVGFRNRQDRDQLYQTNEGIFVLSHDGDRWCTDWHHEGTHREYHTVVFENDGLGDSPMRMYYMEDAPYDAKSGGGVFEVYYRNGRWTNARIFSERLNIKAAGNITGDGGIEFLVFDSPNLKVYSKSGKELWDIQLPETTREIPHAWIGNVNGKQRIVSALHMGDYVNMTSRIYVWEERDGLMRDFWKSEALGNDGITSMMVRDLNKDGIPEILINHTNDYLIWGQHFEIFEP